MWDFYCNTSPSFQNPIRFQDSILYRIKMFQTIKQLNLIYTVILPRPRCDIKITNQIYFMARHYINAEPTIITAWLI